MKRNKKLQSLQRQSRENKKFWEGAAKRLSKSRIYKYGDSCALEFILGTAEPFPTEW